MSQVTRKDEKVPVHVRDCEFCDATVTVSGWTGPSEICGDCAARLRAVVMDGAPLPAEFAFPLAQPVPASCGLRADLPKRDRVHDWAYLGTDPRHTEAGFRELHVSACRACGRDRQARTPPGDQP
jgi:hypothetical protein